MSKHILITGGAGFIGSHLADELLKQGHRIRILDNLSPQVHGDGLKPPDYLSSETELIIGDITDESAVRRALIGIDAVYHFASLVGVGQSMYEINRYTHVNNYGTAVLLQAIVEKPIERLIVASSMSLYGEGMYRTQDCRYAVGVERSVNQLKAKDWEVRNSDRETLIPIPTPETKVPSIASVYALSKYDQERLCLMIGRAYNVPTVALRFFSVFGTRQALSNPYTGVLAIFASRYLNNRPPMIFEDGYQKRDFVSVHDVTQACRLALDVPQAAYQTFNIGSGQHYTIREIAQRMARALGKEDIRPEITGEYRVGDIRHCFADISFARQVLQYEPQITLEAGLLELVSWLEGRIAVDHVVEARAELTARGLTV